MNQLEESLLRPLADDELEGIPEFLKNYGFEPKVAGAALRCDQVLRGQRCVVLYFYPAERLLALKGLGEDEKAMALRSLWAELFYEEFSKKPRLDQYFYALGHDETDTVLQTSGLTQTLESDQSYARKHVRMPHELRWLLSSVFPSLPEEFRANKEPSLQLLRELSEDPAAVTAVTHWLTPGGSGFDAREPSEMDRRRMEVLYSRIMGRNFRLLWEDDRYTLMNGCAGVLPEHASRGEQAGYAIARFLAMSASYLEPGMTLGIQGMLHNLDALKRLAALDEMRHFTASSGVSFVIQTANTRVLEMALQKFRFLAEASYR